MEQSMQDLVHRLDQFSSLSRELREGIRQAVRIAAEDPEMSLTRARKVLEYLVRRVYESRIQEPAGTRPLENLLQRLGRDGHFPKRLAAYANTVRELGNVGTHGFGERITAQDVLQSLSQLMPIAEWYAEQEAIQSSALADIHRPAQEPASGQSGSFRAPAGERPLVVPRGLRSFDARDSDFFLCLLPGPRDRDGLPESIAVWKERVEPVDELTFTVGLIYGPSGCGKSSLVKAGLVPRLAGHVVPVYVEAAPDDTEAGLLKGLHKRCPRLPAGASLLEALVAVRTGAALAAGQKVLLVLDQFEQWLQARQRQPYTELVQALRQCDGQHLQCLVLVRDDFGMAATRFMGSLEMPILQGQNFATVDLFDLRHARRVLAEFGRAFGCLPADLSRLSGAQERFLDQAAAGLAQDGKVIPVRLALFAEMVKSRPWLPATLKQLGGAEGIGVAFLEETFGSRSANPEHRRHQQAARAVLKALLPEQGTDLKGHRRAHEELLDASGCAQRPREFHDLLRILDTELRLVTPTDPEGKDEGGPLKDEGKQDEGATASSFILHPSSLRYYQLTHDYLVPSLRQWLTRKQRETRRGRAASLLADYAAEQPEVLAELAKEADARVYAVLLPLLQRHAPRTATLMNRELDRALIPDWKDTPLSPSWPAPATAQRRLVEARPACRGDDLRLRGGRGPLREPSDAQSLAIGRARGHGGPAACGAAALPRAARPGGQGLAGQAR
jgi:hypothetical protein